MKNKLSKGLSLSLSANPEHLIKGAFSAVQHVFAGFSRKNDTSGNNKHRSNITGGTKPTPLAPVILGLVPRIFWQRVSNLVNKFALLLHKCWLREDSRNKSENDWCRGRWLSAFCKFFKYPSPDAKASPSPSRGEGFGLLRCYTPRNDAERTNIVLKGLDVVRQYAALLERRVQTGTRARKALVVTRQANPLGRSMIEMLGVLAIIGVLSVGGIAGYSKAMMKWKINKAVEEYNFLIQGLMEYKDNLVKSNPEVGQVKLGEFIKAANLVPETWTTSDGLYMTDSMGNGNAPYLNNQGHMIVIDIYFAKYQNSQAAEYSYRFCEALFMDIAYPLAAELHGIFLYGSGYSSVTFRGTKSCKKADDFKCLQDLTLSDVNKECRACIVGENGRCGAVIVF